MSLLEGVLRSIDRRPRAKRRFNLLREETPSHLGRQRGLSALGPVVLFATIPLAGIWQIQSDLDPLLTNVQISGQGSGLNESKSARPGSFPESLPASADSKPLDSRLPPEGRGHRLRGNDMHAKSSGLSADSGEGGATKNHPKPTHPLGRRVSGRAHHVQAKEQVFYRKAQGYHKQKNFEMAVELYRQVLQKSPGHCDALFHLSSIYMEQSAYAEAYPLVQKLVKGDPRDPQALVNLAIAEIALGRPEKAVAHLDQALSLADPPRFEICFHQGVALSRLERLEEAVTWYKKSEDLDPGHAHLLFNMAVTFDKLERYENALDCYARFLKTSGSSSLQERRDVEARIGVLTAYLAQEPGSFVAEGTHSITGQER
jgi:Flp pilus assembly protein TadD